MKIDFSKEEVDFIIESMEYAQLSFDTSYSTKYGKWGMYTLLGLTVPDGVKTHDKT